MKNEEKAQKIAKDNRQHYYDADADSIISSKEECYDSAMEMAKWKDEQYRIDKAHLDMIYEALDRLYKIRYGDQLILNTGSQTDVFLSMIEDIINETKQK